MVPTTSSSSSSTSSQKVILTGLPPTVSRDAILAWLHTLGPTLVSLTPGKAKSDGTQKPAHASLEFRVHPKSAHPYALVEATESLHDTLRRMPPFMDAGGVVWPVEPCWPFHTRVPGRGDAGGPSASGGSGAGAVAASRDPYEGTLEADPLWRDFQARREGPPGGSLASSSAAAAAAAAAAGKLRDLGEGGGEDAAPKAIPALVTFLLNKSRAQASAAAASKRTAAAASAAGGPRVRGKGKVGGPFSGSATGGGGGSGGGGGGRTAAAAAIDASAAFLSSLAFKAEASDSFRDCTVPSRLTGPALASNFFWALALSNSRWLPRVLK